jgi:hypothetical protein
MVRLFVIKIAFDPKFFNSVTDSKFLDSVTDTKFLCHFATESYLCLASENVQKAYLLPITYEYIGIYFIQL